MLRPSKIFVSVHQLRHYFNTRISELVSHQPTQLAIQLKHGATTTQQMMAFFSGLQKTVIPSKAPIQTIPNEKYLIQKIHQHFPVTKSFSSPTLHQRVWVTANLRPRMGFCRPTTALGLNSAVRQYTTTPFVPVFQHNAAAPTNSVFSHISSRIFTPVATKLNNQPENSCQKTPLVTRKEVPKETKPLGAKVFKPEPVLTSMSVNEDSKLDSIVRSDDLHEEHAPSQLNSKKTVSPTARSVYLLIPMDATQFWKTRAAKNRWSTERLCSSFVDSIEQMAYEYQVHIDSVLKLLDRLERYGKFRTVTGEHELRIYFPPSVQSKEEAMLVLETFYITTGKTPCFSIEVEDCQFDEEEEEEESVDSSIGSDYFRDLHLFLDHTDYLIEANPLFSQR